MDNTDKKAVEYLALVARSQSLASRASMTVAMAGTIQELLNMNQQLASALSELVENAKNERKRVGTNPDDK